MPAGKEEVAPKQFWPAQRWTFNDAVLPSETVSWKELKRNVKACVRS